MTCGVSQNACSMARKSDPTFLAPSYWIRYGTSPGDLLHSYGKKVTSTEVGQHIADAYLFFARTMEEWLGTTKESAKRIGALYQAIREHLQMVVIDLGRDDDAQMIFETLNARGT